MLQDAALFLLRVVLELAASAFWLRFYMQWARVPFHNPFAQFVVRVTNFAVKPLRRVVPGLFGLDLTSLILFGLMELLWVFGSYLIMGYPFLLAGGAVVPAFLLLTLSEALNLAIYILMGLVFIQAIMSWVNPYSPFASVFHALARPIVSPFQRFIPPVGGVDLSPMAAIIVLQLLLIAPIAGLERFARGML